MVRAWGIGAVLHPARDAANHPRAGNDLANVFATRRVLAVPRYPQPDATSCGPTCLAQVLQYYGIEAGVEELVGRVSKNADGGTQAVHLAHLAMDLGLKVRLYPFGARVFDPSWWDLDTAEVVDRLDRRGAALTASGADPDDVDTLRAWRELLARGGQIAFKEPSVDLMISVLARGRPLIAGLNATWLYREMRERPQDNVSDDLAGWPVGHFVVLSGYTGGGLHVHVRDPSDDAPDHLHPTGARRGNYPVPGQRLLNAILLGDSTRDAVLLETWPSAQRAKGRT